MTRTLHLVIPHLLAVWPAETLTAAPRPPALERLLTRATVSPAPVGPAATLLSLFGLASDPAPVAALTRLGDGAALDTVRRHWWLRADPVHLVADLHQVRLFDPCHLHLDQSEATALAAEFNRIYGADGLHLDAAHPQRWYLALTEPAAIVTHSPDAAIGQDIQPLLPTGPDRRRWQALLTEVQMLFYTSPINEARLRRGQLPVNGLWFWGGGELPEQATAPVTELYADDPLTRGLARLANAAISPAPASAADWQDSATGDSLIVLDSGATDPEARHEQLEALERDWFAPLLDLCRRNRLHLHLYPGHGQVYRVTAADLRRFWRRNRPLATHLERA